MASIPGSQAANERGISWDHAIYDARLADRLGGELGR